MYYILKAWKIIKRFAVDTMKTIMKHRAVNGLKRHTFYKKHNKKGVWLNEYPELLF